MTSCITVFGGTGFIGRHLVALLLQRGATVRVGVRHPGRVKMAADWAKAPEIVQAGILDDKTVDSAITGADAVVNPVGILTEAAARHSRRRRPASSIGGPAPWRDTLDPHIRPRCQPDISGDLRPDEG